MSQHASDSPQPDEDDSADRNPVEKPSETPSASDAERARSERAGSQQADTEQADTDPSFDDASTDASLIVSPAEGVAIASKLDQSESQNVDDPASDSAIRIGSPFAVDPFGVDPARAVEAFYDVGPLKYTAMGAVSASVMVVGFAAAAAYFFPVGGTMIAALGCVLSILGMYSSYRLTAAGLLAIHLCLFVLSYGRTMS